jgi:Tol biopolymer transport system component
MQSPNTAPIFNPKFNQFQTITTTEAWSLFFSGSNKDRLLGSDSKTGNYLTLVLFGAVIASAIEIVIAHPM